MSDDQNFSVEELAEALKDLGYKAQVSSSKDFVESATGGLRFAASLAEETVQFNVGMRNDDFFGLGDANRFNAVYRFAKVFLDSDNDIVLQADFILESQDLKSSLNTPLKIWDAMVSNLDRMIREKAMPSPVARHARAQPQKAQRRNSERKRRQTSK